MSAIGQPERVTQNRVIKLFREVLGYDYLGDWSERSNSNVEEACSLPTSRGWPTIL